MKSVFNDMMELVNSQAEQQKVLMLFADTEESKKSRKRKEKSGTISPTMVVDKVSSELSQFSDLVSEADSISKDWQLVFFACLSGENGNLPSDKDTEFYLQRMADDVHSGNNVSQYVVLDRDENPIELTLN